MLAGAAQCALSDTISGSPETYTSLVRKLRAGDVLRLAPGRYEHGLRLHDLHGAAGNPIVIEGATGNAPTVFIGRPGHNTVSLVNASHIVIRSLVLDGGGLEVDAVRAERRETLVHHIGLENLTIVRHGPEQQTVGISTAAPAAFWTIRNNVIVGAGTGLYLGNPDGTAPFVAGVIEGNLVADTTGYNLQIKHQGPRPALTGMPERPSETLIRGNVFSKAENSSTGKMARPNVLLGHFPLEGAGSDDVYRVEANVLYRNPTEALLQAEGNVTIEGNLFLNPDGDGVALLPHNDVPRRVHVRDNFIESQGTGLQVRGAHPGYTQTAENNLVYGTRSKVGAPGPDSMRPIDDVPAVLAEWLKNRYASGPDTISSSLQRAVATACKSRQLSSHYASRNGVLPASHPACLGLISNSGSAPPSASLGDPAAEVLTCRALAG
jgi:hypothetical protein